MSLNPGKYAAVVVPVKTEYGELAAQFGRSSKKKTPQVSIAFEVLRGPEAGRVISWIGYFTDATEDRTLDALRICGFEGNDIDTFAEQRPTNEVEIVVENEQDDRGRVQTRVAWVNSPSRGFKMADQLQDKELKKFGAGLKAKLKTIPVVKGTVAKREPASDAPTGGGSGRDEDESQDPNKGDRIPF